MSQPRPAPQLTNDRSAAMSRCSPDALPPPLGQAYIGRRPRIALLHPLLLGGLLVAAGLWATRDRSRVATAAPDGVPPPSPGVSVRSCGAVGDGQADDTEAILRALRQGSVYFPRGVYRITKTLDIDLSATGPLTLQGDSSARVVMSAPGPAFRIRGTHAGTADPASVQPSVWTNERFPTVSGFEITGTDPEADGIEALGTMKLTVTRMLIRQVRHAIRLRERNRNVLIADCHIYDNRGMGIWFDKVNLHQSNISACHVSYCREGGIVVRGGDVRNVHISGCDIEGNMSPTTPPTANVLFDCADGSVAEAAIVGCTIQHDAKSPGSANIRFLGRGKVPRRGQILDFQCGHVTIADNVLSDVHFNIELRGVRGATVCGNTLWQGYSANLVLEDCAHVAIGANMLERNPLYGYAAEACNRVVFRRCQDLTIQGLHVHQVIDAEAGMLIEDCDRLHVSGCTILDCDRTGLLLRNVTRSSVTACVIRDDRKDAPFRSVPLRLEGENTGSRWENNVLEGVPPAP